MKNFILFNAIGIPLMTVGLFLLLEGRDSCIPCLFFGLASVAVGYREGFKAQKP